MAKYRVFDFICRECGHQFEETVDVNDPDYRASVMCPHCETTRCEKLPNAAGGYSGSFGGSSTSPRHRGSFKRGTK